ncbi:MAG: hypothetical protein M3Y54_03280 [Bacteroidota bacterium]|nr:hypothetical protein [Bacteroidota bacterium]
MLNVFHELLPESYLVILAPGPAGQPEAALAYRLRRAARSGKNEVWVDCSLVPTFSEEVAGLLWAAHQALQEQGARLVLVHLSDQARQLLLAREMGTVPRIVPTLLDAACPVAYHY